ncbi:DUF3857 and transglutaminase domain-containing protein [Labilibaculum sp. K2S]|uniref:DUF3857 and transglutaminase domain-containing protein n=1 Tax=Labilibaculum sp. K2S TaxID=3056386 RepID=UPI0025A4AEE6|nr:DUF3857 and transglutaminase domain-containing protein [Labilibaculum sp. K2S]MDM8158967.1 DUF3857 and transglutaminase domain-containing protein [Labilibaculum sp. K2S]
MKYIKQFLLLIIFILSIVSNSNAKGIKFGNVSKDEFALKECPYEKDASAVILSRTCSVDLSYSIIRYFYHVRIKILKEEGIDQANIKLAYYRNNNIENISGVKAHTINLNEQGKQEVAEIANSLIFDVDVDENYGEVRFTMPDVKVGSIIEYKYTTNSHFYSYLDTWYFQDEIPTLNSSLKVNMPESFRYNIVMFGSQIQAKYPESKNNQWTLTNMPSIKEESHVNNYHDFVEQLRFQLAGYFTRDESTLSGSPIFVNSMTTYEELAKEYSEKVNFLGRTNFAKKQLETILDGNENKWEKLQKIYDFVRTNVKWNGKYRIYPGNSPPNVLDEKSGTNSEINYLLVLLLQEAGFDCNPALARSNTRGLIQKAYPLLSQFDQVLAFVELYGKRIFLNATSPYRPFDLIAEKDLNYHAFVLKKGNPFWAEIKPNEKNHQDVLITYDYSNSENPVCKLRVRENGYFAAKSHKELTEAGSESWMTSLFDLEKCDFQKDSLHFQNRDDVNLSLKMQCDLKLENSLDQESDYIYVNLFNKKDLKNPFLKESRQYRVDYNYPRSRSYIVKIILPEGYQFEDFPKRKKIILSGETGKYTLDSQIIGKELCIRTSFSINATSFSKEYYGDLREFYSQMSKMMGSKVVIKRSN